MDNSPVLPKYTSGDSRDYSKPVVFMTVEQLYQRHNLIQSLKDAESIVWITRKRV